MRTECTRHLLDELEIAVLKGNAGEIGVVAGAEGRVRGVDSHGLEGDPVAVARDLARSLGITVAVSGATDIVTNGRRVFLVENGHPMMGSISGTGCMAASVTGAFAAVSRDPFSASVAAFAAFGIPGERAAAVSCGPGSFKRALFDELAALVPADLSSCARIRSPSRPPP